MHPFDLQAGRPHPYRLEAQRTPFRLEVRAIGEAARHDLVRRRQMLLYRLVTMILTGKLHGKGPDWAAELECPGMQKDAMQKPAAGAGLGLGVASSGLGAASSGRGAAGSGLGASGSKRGMTMATRSSSCGRCNCRGTGVQFAFQA